MLENGALSLPSSPNADRYISLHHKRAKTTQETEPRHDEHQR